MERKAIYEFRITARALAEKEICYRDISDFGLRADIRETASSEEYTEYELTVENTNESEFRGVVHCEAAIPSREPEIFMPAFIYNRNRGNVEAYKNRSGEIAMYPRLSMDEKEMPYSDYWMVCANRLSHPVSILYDSGEVLGISAQPLNEDQSFNGFSCKIGKEQSAVGFTLGYENAPGVYIDSATGCEIKRDIENTSVCVEGKSGICVSFRVYSFRAENELGINKIIRETYCQYHQSPRKASGYKETVSDISKAIFEDAYVEEIKNYSTRVFMKDGRVMQEPLGSISWTGGVEVATPMLYAAARLADQAMREQACTVIDYVVKNSLNEDSHLPFDAYDQEKWYTDGWWDFDLKESGHSSYLVGQALYYILSAYEIEKKFFGKEREEWICWVKQVLEHIETTKNESGEVPHIWSAEDGSALDYDSFSGCWCVAAAAYYCRLTGDLSWLESAKKSVNHYYNAYICKMECYGTPHDTLKAVDSEGSLAFIKACKKLHEMTEEEAYLEMLQDAMEYEFTFKFCWNPPIQYEPLKRLNWSSCGGSVTSTCNPHIHPMSNNVMDEILYCFRKTQDLYFKERLKDTALWAMQTYTRYDGEYDYGKKGWMSERFCYSDGLMIEKYPNGSLCSTWKCFLPWGASNIIEGLCGDCWETIENI